MSAHAAPRYEATITRTTYGVPHVEAKDFGGLGFGAAYAQAQDNICLMADGYVSASGQRSHYFGADGPTVIGLVPAKNIDSDLYYATMLDTKALRAGFAKTSPDSRALIAGWVAGYNRFLRDNRGKLPAKCAGQRWVRDITRDDVLRSLNGFTMLAGSAMAAAKIAGAAPPADQPDRAAVQPVASALQFADEARASMKLGSNGWAFGGDATTNGRGLVVGNPHFPWYGPNRFYQIHLTIPGKFDVAGAAITNQPYVGIGFNKDVAWTHTVDTAAHMTLFKLTLDPADPTAYIVDGKRVPMERREIRVETKDGAPVVRTLYVSRYGPILSMPGTDYAWTRQTAYAIADANKGNVRSGEGYLAMARARSVRDIHDALARYIHAPFLNTLAADRNGDALYADISPAANVSAERFAACSGSMSPPTSGFLQRLYVLDGSRSACEWEKTRGTAAPGLLPPSQMAAIYRRDYVQNSNDSYRWTNIEAPIAELGPMMGPDFHQLPSMRTRSGLQEIRRVLHSGKFDIDLGIQTMLGNKNFAGDLAMPAVRKLCERPDAPKPACAALAKWDGKTELESRGAMLFAIFWGKTGLRADVWADKFDRDDVVGTPRTLAIDGAAGDKLLADLAYAADTLTKMGIALDAPLGEVQFAERGAERIPISGSPAGVLNYTAGLPVKGGFGVVHGASYVQSVAFDEKGPVAKAILTYSQSTDPASPHYADQTREFSKLALHPYPFSKEEIAAQAIGEPLTIRQ
ncbi:penicillin acylase family protein [Sphingopyxis panaciterrae]